jgi:hypothetical protein
MKEPEQGLVHEYARQSDQAEAESKFSLFTKEGVEHFGGTPVQDVVPVKSPVPMTNSWSSSTALHRLS